MEKKDSKQDTLRRDGRWGWERCAVGEHSAQHMGPRRDLVRVVAPPFAEVEGVLALGVLALGEGLDVLEEVPG